MARTVNRSRRLQDRLVDRRGRRVIFLSHCLLNENARYLGGACVAGALRHVLEKIDKEQLGVVQMPCPEQEAWGGISKPMFLLAYGPHQPARLALLRLILPLFVGYTSIRFRLLARRQAAHIQDYVRNGFEVQGVIAVDGSPSCGLNRTVDIRKAFALHARLPVDQVTVEDANRAVVQSAINGEGLFISSLRRQLRRRGISVGWSAHDLLAELRQTWPLPGE